MSKPAAAAAAAVAPKPAAPTRIPVLHVAVACSGPSAVFPVKVDARMTVETLREAAWTLYSSFCQDEGVAFAPPSLAAADYDIRPLNAAPEVLDATKGAGATLRRRSSVASLSATGNAAALARSLGSASLGPAWAPFHGGGPQGAHTVREWIAQHAAGSASRGGAPVAVSMVIGARWLERDAVLVAEAQARERIDARRAAFVRSALHFAEVSLEKRREQQVFRTRQSATAARCEDALVAAYAGLRKAEAKVRAEHAALCALHSGWARLLERRAAAFDAADGEKRVFLGACRAAVACHTRAEGRAGA